MMTVWKFPLTIADRISVEMPAGAKILHIAEQGQGQVFIWALVNTANPMRERHLCVRGTGHPSDGVGDHIATFFAFGDLVFHVFEGGQRK